MENFKLNEHDKIDAGFKIPDGYFEDFTSRLMTSIETGPKVIRLKPQRRYRWLTIAAVLAMALSIPAIDSLQISSVGKADGGSVENYLAYQSGLSTDDIAEAMTPDDISRIHITYADDQNEIEAALSQNTDIQNYID
jgi:hypothetical protein